MDYIRVEKVLLCVLAPVAVCAAIICLVTGQAWAGWVTFGAVMCGAVVFLMAYFASYGRITPLECRLRGHVPFVRMPTEFKAGTAHCMRCGCHYFPNR